LGTWPALDVRHPDDPDLTLALVFDFHPTAAESRDNDLRIFFSTATARDAAHTALAAARYRAERVDVDDEDWARRSQENIGPVTVGSITVVPPAEDVPQVLSSAAARTGPGPSATIVIRASMGFGTGHHATTRLCLLGLQTVDLTARFVLDIGTGSGVLALAAVKLGAAGAVGIDYDGDAIQAANENLGLNPDIDTVEFRAADLLAGGLPTADIVTANLTGALLVRQAALLLQLLRPTGTLIVSGLLEEEEDDVVEAFRSARVVWKEREEGWVALGLE
jgi:ribosomal protein L11 methyltransferase